MSGQELSTEITQKCKGKCPYYDLCFNETVDREKVSKKSLKSYNCRLNPTKETK